ncbi:probable G-protein coupled receptor No9 [Stylophora pistillata]|uniref:probable G-protein coupled receptor No9 n=1 Tax=Stylophora pistillata TaxID=50429 RepID=UPI000C057A42|nr:probable G-protein coupled receptor No9 [Stylophora pistillata]
MSNINCSTDLHEISNCTDLSTKKSSYSAPYVNVVTFFYILIIVTSLAAYGIIIATVCMNRRLRTICNYFIVSLGIADLMIVSMVIPVNIGLILGTFRFKSAEQCVFLSTVNLVSLSAVSLNLCTVSMERFFAIAFPFKYEAFTTTKATAGVIGTVWVYSLVAALLPLMGWRARPAALRGHVCLNDNVESYTLFMAVGSFFIPAFIMLTTNTIVYRIAANQAKRIFRVVPAMGPSAEKIRKNFRAAKRISLIVGAYLLCWVPHMVVLVMGLIIGARSIPLFVYPITLSLQYSCSAVNPCLFCFTNQEMRGTLKRMAWKVLRRTPDITLSSDRGLALERRRSTAHRISQATDISALGSKGDSRTTVRACTLEFSAQQGNNECNSKL